MKKLSRGFTIVELLIYTTILLGLLYIFTSMFGSILDVQLESETQSAIIQDSGYIFARLSYDIGRANSIQIPSSLGASSSLLTLGINGVDSTYSLSNGTLLLTRASDSAALNSFGTTVSNISFRRYGNVSGKNSISVSYTLTATTQRTGGSESQDFQSTIGLR